MKWLVFVCMGLAAPLLTAAELGRWGDWTVIDAEGQSGDVIAVTTGNNSQELLAYRCAALDVKCSYILVAGSTCEKNASYPILMNAPAGAATVEGFCFQSSDKLNDMGLKPYKVIEDSLSKGNGYIGFAIPMASGAFKAVRFSTNGAASAVKEAERMANQRSKSKQNSGKANSGYF